MQNSCQCAVQVNQFFGVFEVIPLTVSRFDLHLFILIIFQLLVHGMCRWDDVGILKKSKNEQKGTTQRQKQRVLKSNWEGRNWHASMICVDILQNDAFQGSPCDHLQSARYPSLFIAQCTLVGQKKRESLQNEECGGGRWGGGYCSPQVCANLSRSGQIAEGTRNPIMVNVMLGKRAMRMLVTLQEIDFSESFSLPHQFNVQFRDEAPCAAINNCLVLIFSKMNLNYVSPLLYFFPRWVEGWLHNKR